MTRIAQFDRPEGPGITGEPGDQLSPAPPMPETWKGEGDIVDMDGQTWDAVFRAIQEEDRQTIAATMEAAVKNPMIGYSQGLARYTFREQLVKHGGDASKINTPCNADCSSSVTASVLNAGIPVLYEMTTANERESLMETGDFLEITDPDLIRSSMVLRGDILWRPGHTAVVLDDGCDVKASEWWILTECALWQRTSAGIRPDNKRDAFPSGLLLLSLAPYTCDDWALVQTLDKSWYWINSNHLRIKDRKTLIVTGYTVNVRERPSLDSEVTEVARAGWRYIKDGPECVDERGVTWYHVRRDREPALGGYISSKYAEEYYIR